MDAQLKTDITVFCERDFDHYWGAASAEQKAMADAEMGRYMAEPEFAAAEMAKMNEDFAAADANADGKLDLAEFITFMNKMKAREEAKGSYWNPSMNMEEQFGLHNRVEEGDGVTMQAFMGTMGVWMEVWGAKRAAAQ